MKAYKLDAIPFADARMDGWRDSLRGGVVVSARIRNDYLRRRRRCLDHIQG
jgi:hypothetical protein